MKYTEEELIRRYKIARDEAAAFNHELERHYFGIIRTLPETVEGLAEVRKLFDRCPECVTRVFIMDAIRQREIKLGLREPYPPYPPTK